MAPLAFTPTVPDMIVLGLGVVLGIRGAMKGFAWQLVRTIGLIAGLWGATRFYEPVGDWLDERLPVPEMTTPVIAWLGIMAATILVFGFLAFIVKGAVKSVNLGGLDRVLGFVLGGVMALTFAAIAFVLWGHFAGEDELHDTLEHSVTARFMAETVDVVEPLFPVAIRERFRKSLDALDKAGEE
ncbi:MAG: CvpA family protein [Planctomycetota bacterium]|nr:CvpA family protein [Planctomycetota bacterium]